MGVKLTAEDIKDQEFAATLTKLPNVQLTLHELGRLKEIVKSDLDKICGGDTEAMNIYFQRIFSTIESFYRKAERENQTP